MTKMISSTIDRCFNHVKRQNGNFQSLFHETFCYKSQNARLLTGKPKDNHFRLYSIISDLKFPRKFKTISYLVWWNFLHKSKSTHMIEILFKNETASKVATRKY